VPQFNFGSADPAGEWALVNVPEFLSGGRRLLPRNGLRFLLQSSWLTGQFPTVLLLPGIDEVDAAMKASGPAARKVSPALFSRS
jgi:hypothetical protein